MKKKTKETTAAKEPQKRAKTLGRTSIRVAAHQLRPAPWNPRPEITSESVEDLTASIGSIGLIQPLVVMRDPDKPSVKGVDFYLIVAGHRRFRACVDAGLEPIPCDLLDVDVDTAKRMTILENLQRRDADPLLESELVASLLDSGMSQAEIAAETGRGEKWVARRANLRKLSKSWRKRVADGDQITIDCLEHIAAYPENIQEKCKDVRGGYYGEAMSWCSIRYTFRRESRDLRDVPFDTSPCLKCPNNTGCCPDLFDEDSRNHLGQCLDAKCYTKLIEEAVESAIAKAKKKGRVIVKGAPYKYGIYGETKRPTKTNTTLYVYEDGSGNKVLEYAAPPPKKDADAEKEAKAARREEKKRDKLIAAARIEAQEKFDEWFSERKKDGKWPKWIIDMALDDFYAHAEDVIDMWATENGFTASDENANEVYREYLKAQKEAAEEAAKKRKEHEPSDDAEDDGLPAEADDI
jgi:ParB/RepB/Spo0J family partition protein